MIALAETKEPRLELHMLINDLSDELTVAAGYLYGKNPNVKTAMSALLRSFEIVRRLRDFAERNSIFMRK